MSVIDWSKAPEGATHYCPKGAKHDGTEYGEHWLKPGFYRLPGWKNWEEEKCRAPEDILIPRPPRAWSGEGLPPVGIVCEVDYCEQWQRCEVVAHFQQRCGMVAAFTVEFGDGAKSLDAFGAESFRPIRTPEQIAADEREAQVVAIHDAIVTSVKVTLGQCDSWRKVAEMVYDAGFKRE